MQIPAIVTAGDGSAAKAVRGESKVFLELDGEPLVARVVRALQQVPEVSEVWVVGNAERLEAALRPLPLAKPLHVVPQLRHLWENCWETYRRCLSGDSARGRDPESESDLDLQILFLSGDLPFATPQEISAFVRRGRASDCDYALGLVTDEALTDFLPARPGEPGIEVAYFNLREARFRQSNLHLCRPGRLGNRHYIEEMYQHRYQREIGNMLALAWRLLVNRQGGVTLLFFFVLMHVAGWLDRWGWSRLADRVRRGVDLARVERAVGRLLDTRFAFVTTEVGGCAIDIDTDEEYEAALRRGAEWRKLQEGRAASLHGPVPLAGPVAAGDRLSGGEGSREDREDQGGDEA